MSEKIEDMLVHHPSIILLLTAVTSGIHARAYKSNRMREPFSFVYCQSSSLIRSFKYSIFTYLTL
ncbi:MAG: hypothetical protein Sylvanvirus5_17 [Sylvanvirus sp.]|uniref:Uncharacterized protein n=1 Tax=Sylvanvirus sp. TaxID=2487774 RepID=A0A3G5AL18_9VIRU|nr:MAG: hypothetical protein Sylvanvirus5_17 [Sylvanvirus sp.]